MGCVMINRWALHYFPPFSSEHVVLTQFVYLYYAYISRDCPLRQLPDLISCQLLVLPHNAVFNLIHELQFTWVTVLVA